jgi:glucose 1-dehydrogenase
MHAITVVPGLPNSARIEEVAEPPLSDGSVLVRTVGLGVCGTDRDIVAGLYGESPAGRKRLILGHESLGVVQEAAPGSGFSAGDLVVGIVRRPDPVPCPACAAGEWDMCHNGRYTERGIKARDGYGAELFRVEPQFAVKLDPDLGELGVLMEPTSIVAKAWDQVERIGCRSAAWDPKTLMITGCGPIGLLAAMMGAQRRFDLHVLDHRRDPVKRELVQDLGGMYHVGDAGILDQVRPDVVMECSGAPDLIAEIFDRTAPCGIVCLLGVTAPGNAFKLDIGRINRTMVLDNHVIFGSVNANRSHYASAAEALARADRAWLARLITRRVPLERWSEALDHRAGDIKVMIRFAGLDQADVLELAEHQRQ